nr:SDR family NAD(P)-dependent oxidoreductase [Rhizobium anhuiense]
MSHLPPLAGQSVLVTGASGGIGAAIVERLSAEGARPVIHHGRDREGAEALLRKIGGAA